jgi:hypothetical protein
VTLREGEQMKDVGLILLEKGFPEVIKVTAAFEESDESICGGFRGTGG